MSLTFVPFITFCSEHRHQLRPAGFFLHGRQQHSVTSKGHLHQLAPGHSRWRLSATRGGDGAGDCDHAGDSNNSRTNHDRRRHNDSRFSHKRSDDDRSSYNWRQPCYHRNGRDHNGNLRRDNTIGTDDNGNRGYNPAYLRDRNRFMYVDSYLASKFSPSLSLSLSVCLGLSPLFALI